jgi:hypothetical protein
VRETVIFHDLAKGKAHRISGRCCYDTHLLLWLLFSSCVARGIGLPMYYEMRIMFSVLLVTYDLDF